MTVIERTPGRVDETVSPRCVIYCRISLDATGDEHGVERQEQACRELAERNGWTVDRVVSDNNESAMSGKRPGWAQLLADIEAGTVSHLVAWHNDRLMRRSRDLEHFIDVVNRTNLQVHTVMAGDYDLQSATGRMIARIIGATAQAESERTGERITNAMKQRAEHNKAHGGPRPFGYRRPDIEAGEPPSPSLIQVPDEVEVIRWMLDRVQAGDSLRSIAEQLNEQGVTTSSDGEWRSSQVGRLLRHPRLYGRLVYKGGEMGEGDWEPITDRTTFERVGTRLDRAVKFRQSGRQPRTSLLVGFVYCEMCGGPLTTSSTSRVSNKSGERITTRTYRCDKNRSDVSCGKMAATADNVDGTVIDRMLVRLSATNLSQAHLRQSVDDSTRLVADIQRDDADLAALTDQFARAEITRHEWEVLRQAITARSAENRAKLDAMRGETDTELPDAIWSGIDRADFDAMTGDEQRAVVAVMVSRVMIAPGNRGNRWDGSRVSVEWRLA